MAVILNQKAFEHANALILEGRCVYDERDDWSEHRPSAADENGYIRANGMDAYANWYLGIDEEKPKDTKGAYEFPYGDFENVHRCGILAAESRAGQYKHGDVASAVAHLHEMIEAERKHGGVRAGGSGH
jgi:hypothetical protein